MPNLFDRLNSLNAREKADLERIEKEQNNALSELEKKGNELRERVRASFENSTAEVKSELEKSRAEIITNATQFESELDELLSKLRTQTENKLKLSFERQATKLQHLQAEQTERLRYAIEHKTAPLVQLVREIGEQPRRALKLWAKSLNLLLAWLVLVLLLMTGTWWYGSKLMETKEQHRRAAARYENELALNRALAKMGVSYTASANSLVLNVPSTVSLKTGTENNRRWVRFTPQAQ